MEIDAWFSANSPYTKGVVIYKELGTNSGLKTLFGFGKTAYNEKKLYSELLAISEAMDAKNFKPKTQNPKNSRSKNNTDPELAKLYRERHVLHAQLSVLPSKSDRYRVAKRIMAITKRVEQMLGIREDEPTKIYAIPEDGGKRVQLRNVNRAYITKFSKRSEKVGEVNRRIKENEVLNELLK